MFLSSNEHRIREMQTALKSEQRRVRGIKQLYVKEMTAKAELEKILRKAVEDMKEEIIQLKGENRVVILHSPEAIQARERREDMIDRLINNEKILTLVYDKTFYSDQKNIIINPVIEQSTAAAAAAALPAPAHNNYLRN